MENIEDIYYEIKEKLQNKWHIFNESMQILAKVGFLSFLLFSICKLVEYSLEILQFCGLIKIKEKSLLEKMGWIWDSMGNFVDCYPRISICIILGLVYRIVTKKHMKEQNEFYEQYKNVKV